jgi:precorrin-2 dehydrogenase/sirohydrochlorin ferrochelatase
MLPVVLNLAGRLVVVVGGGGVGRRKAEAARAAGAAVRIVDPRPAGPEQAGVEWVAEAYRADHLTGAALAFACGPAEVNARVVADAAARGVWVNSATDPEAGDFVLPAAARRGGLTLAVSTGGASPALARRLRDRLAAALTPALAAWADALEEARAAALATIPDAAARRAVLEALADWPWLDRVERDGVEATRAAMREAVRRAAGG